MLEWSTSGDSFYITNTQELTKALPHYFKAKSFGSFVRQLNMYHFSKVRGQKLHEFRHPFFRRDATENLRYIRRKQVTKGLRRNSNINLKTCERPNNQVVNSKLMKLETVLASMIRQNRSLEDINEQMTEELNAARSVLNFKVRSLFELMAQLIQQPESIVADHCRDYLKSSQLANSDSSYNLLVGPLNKQLCSTIFAPYDSMSILFIVDGLVNIHQSFGQQIHKCANELIFNKSEFSKECGDTASLVMDSPVKIDDCSVVSIYSPVDNFNPHTIDGTPAATGFASPFGKSPFGLYNNQMSPACEPLLKMHYMTLDDMQYEVFINNSCETAVHGEDDRSFVVKEEI